MKMLIPLEPRGAFGSTFVYLRQQLVCKTVKKLHRASFWPVGHDAAHFITGLELNIMILWHDTKMST